MMLAIGSVVLVAAFIFPPNIFWLTTFIATVFASSWGPVGLMSIWSRRITKSAAFWGMLSGLVFNIVPKFFEFIGLVDFPSYLNPVIIGTTVSLVVTIVVSRKTTVTAVEAKNLEKLHETPDDEVDYKRTRTTVIAPTILMLYGPIMSILMVIYYVFPFQRATGTLLEGDSINWFTGEAILAVSWAFIYVALGFFAIKIIRGNYSPLRKKL